MDFPSKPFHIFKRGLPMPKNAFLTLMQNPKRILLNLSVHATGNRMKFEAKALSRFISSA
jgi:hypothetical protein